MLYSGEKLREISFPLGGIGTGWGDFIKTEKKWSVLIHSGHLELESIVFGGVTHVTNVYADGQKIPFTQDNGQIRFSVTKVKKELKFEVAF